MKNEDLAAIRVGSFFLSNADPTRSVFAPGRTLKPPRPGVRLRGNRRTGTPLPNRRPGCEVFRECQLLELVRLEVDSFSHFSQTWTTALFCG